jgi:hypothetical protein
MNSALLAKLLEAGTPVDLVAEVASELARAEAASELLEQRRAKDRERKRTSPQISEESVESEEIPETAGTVGKGSLEVSPPAPPHPKPSKTAPLSPPKSVEVPDWMPKTEWEAFKEMRRKMRGIPFTATAERTVIGKVAKLKAEGHDPAKLLSKAVERGHRTVFEDETTRTRGPGKLELSAPELRERAEWFVKHGQPDRADECRRKAISIEQRQPA